MIKIGITVTSHEFEKIIYNSGMALNILVWYQMFEKCGFDTYFILLNGQNKKILEKDEITFKGRTYKILDANSEDISNKKDEIFDIDILFPIGTSNTLYYDILKEKNKNSKIIYILLGSVYHNDIRTMYDPEFIKNLGCVDFIYDEVWISPHFERFKDYYKIRYRTENVFVCPYLWEPIALENTEKNILKDTDSLKIGIVEPNLEQSKNCLIPIALCEKANELITKVYAFSTHRFKEHKFFKSYVVGTQLFKDKKITCEKRFALSFILTKHCNCIVSSVRDCDLNYVFLECFYLGIPLVHNSPILKDFGYYYPDYNLDKGKQQIFLVKKSHNHDEYIEKHKSLLFKYSIENPLNVHWVKEKLNGNEKIGDLHP
jgi:hypothetical protein